MLKQIALALGCASLLLLGGCGGLHHHEVTAQSGPEMLAKGEHELKYHNFAKAVSYFEDLDANYPFGAEVRQGQLDIIYAYYRNEDIASSLAAADRYIHLYPRDANVDYAYYMKGLMHFLSGRNWAQNVLPIDLVQRDLIHMQSAFLAFSDLLNRFPKSIYAPDAHQRMLYIRNMLANHELEAAHFYMTHKAYVAASNRASYLVRHFSKSPQVIDGLKVMAQANDALGNRAIADQARSVLAAN